ncbi:hypothetical protein GGQ68_004335 [Sagittula marina]|uniref:Uncharacterized protein n=1 Tax=Sagittula marina TaxID=943940 RepID=A0A7W6DRQ6_9RHOB|nr:hypothetical protein [Sagittula marina]MBB3987981.1 hypothetical protein [Sagittula marina]
MSELLMEGKTPENWAKQLLEHGVRVSPRLIRTKARETGNYYQLGNLMLLSPEQIEALLMAGRPQADQIV